MQKKLYLAASGMALPIGAMFGIDKAKAADSGPRVVMADPDTAKMEPAPIEPSWILSGQPETKAAFLGKTGDGSAQLFVWQTTAAVFHWHYYSDEIIHIVDGETFVTDASGIERRLGPGDVAIFPTGAKTTWRVPHHVRKIAILKRSLPVYIEKPLRWARQAKAWIKPSAGGGGAFAA